jgi:hypothetical protein
MATMLIGGLWHGASWTFVVWGGLHGLYLAVERLLRKQFSGYRPGRVVAAAFTPKPLDDKSIRDFLVRTKLAVDKIRSRGGDVVFVRPPSARDLRVIEDQHLPKAKVWNALLAYTHTNGIHIDDLPAVQNLNLPESSHLSRACATVFIDAYIRSLADQTALLHLKPNSAPRLSTRNCVQSSVADQN